MAATYLPTAPGEYKVSIRFGDKHIKGSPFLAKVTGDGKKRNQVSVPSCTEILLSGDITDADLRTLNGSIQVIDAVLQLYNRVAVMKVIFFRLPVV